jgi:hypothetical protein
MGTGEIAPAQHGETPSGRGLLQSALHSSETRGDQRCLTPAAAQGSARAAARARGGGAAGLGHAGASALAFMGTQEAALAHTDAEDWETPDSGGVLAAAGAGWARMGSARAVGAGWTGLGYGILVQQRLCK